MNHKMQIKNKMNEIMQIKIKIKTKKSCKKTKI